MKSIKQQYIDLQEGRMTQQNFMRNLRMSMPQYITNVTSYNDSIRILKNKGILVEADMKAIPAELAMGIKVEMEHTDDVEVAKKIAMDHLAENPNYYSDLKKSGIDTTQGLKNEPGAPIKSISSTTISVEPNLNKANPRDGFSLGFFEENQEKIEDEAPKTKAFLDKMAATDVKRITPERYAELDKILKDQRKKREEEEKAKIEKAGLKEAKDEKGRWTNADGKSMYDQFREIDNLNGQEVLIGIDYEIEKNHDLTKVAAAKIVLKNLKKNPIYYTMSDLAGKEGAEAEYMGGKSAQPEAHQMQYLDKNMSNVVDKKRGMQPVKGVEKAKKDADARKETNKIEKGVEELTHKALRAKGIKGVMDMTGGNMKKIFIKEALTPNVAQSVLDALEKGYEVEDITNPDERAALEALVEKGYAKKAYSGVDYASGEDIIYWDFTPEGESKIKSADDIVSILKPSTDDMIKESVDKALAKERLKEMIRQELKEMFDGMEPMGRDDENSYLENN